ncbi:MAG: uroporphyrinogen decarboxylase family protein [Eubacteriaceae bacterium]
MNDMMKLSQERTQLFYDIYDSKIPKRVPVNTSVNIVYAAQYCGVNPKEAQWNISLLKNIFDKVSCDFKSDVLPTMMINVPLIYHILGGNSYTMSEQGLLQHAEAHSIKANEFDQLIEDPYKFIVDTILPRLYKNLDTTPGNRSLILANAYKTQNDIMFQMGGYIMETTFKYGFANTAFGGACYAPFDLITDQLRGFTNIVKDIRRIPDKVIKAAEAMLPIAIKNGTNPNPTGYGRTFIPVHMPTFLKTSDFEKFFWPTFKKCIEGLQSNGMGVSIFCEHDWMRYLDYLNELPGRVLMQFEYGDPKLVKNKVGKKHIVSGLYPVSILKSGTKQECIDKAKEYIDLLAPDGGYIFSYDKSPLTIRDASPENIIAVNEFVREYAVYDNHVMKEETIYG